MGVDTSFVDLTNERRRRFVRLQDHARRAFDSDFEATDFLSKPHPELGGQSPFEAAETVEGAQRIERILNALEYGLAI